ncbi:MAG: endolytic transglycosylase MltG [Clostridiales bacterium]|nr:endolytic transglycosylase MltG [Clostridiales bacterium]
MGLMHKPRDRKKSQRGKKIWKALRPVVTFVLSAVVVFLVILFAVEYVHSHFIGAVNTNDATPIEVVIPNGASASSVASLLYNACGEGNEGLIVSTASFKVYVDFVGKANSLRAGTYILSKNMNIAEIVDILCEGAPPQHTTRFVIPEGYNCEDIAAELKKQGLIEEEIDFLRLCNDASLFSHYAFIKDLGAPEGRKYLLEGYLFPDTYEVYTEGGAEDIILKMLTRYYTQYTDEFVERAEELGLSRNQVMVLASIIEREAAVPEDFPRVSAVFHNRLDDGMALQSCATLSYALGVNKFTFTRDEMDTVSLYNTYRNKGLPLGPISNPGLRAIRAALYPDQDFIKDKYLFFCNGNPAESLALIFSKTESEHQKNVEKYQVYWN